MPYLATALTLIFITLIGCGNNQNDTVKNQPPVIHSDIEGLNKHINLPHQPLSVKWMTLPSHGSNWILGAYISFTSEDYSDIIRRSNGYDIPATSSISATTSIAGVFVENLFPKELQTTLILDPVDGRYSSEETIQLQPNLFVSSHLVNGYIVLLGDNNSIFLIL